MDNSIIRFSIFESNSSGHGGEKRTAQITEILNESGIKSKMIPAGSISGGFSIPYLKNIAALFIYFMKVLKITGFNFHPRKFYRTIRSVSHFKDVYDLNKKNIKSKVMLWESTRMEYSFVVPLCKQKEFKIVAIPHNIESLVPKLNSGITNKPSPDWFMEEIKMLRMCDHVFAISKEETLLLRQFGVPANYLPYFPAIETLNYLKKIRNERLNKMSSPLKRKKILMLGSAVNTPTKEGMINRINFFERVDTVSVDLIIAGYGTNQLKSFITNTDNIKLAGELTAEKLSDLLVETDVLLVHQPATSGALTRIVEILLAGIPVLANFESGRNYYGTDGLFLYHNDNQLISYLEADEFGIPVMPEKPKFEIEFFQQTIQTLL